MTEQDPSSLRSRRLRRLWVPQVVLMVLASLAGLYLARPIAIPLATALIFATVLSPLSLAVRHRLHLPAPVAAGGAMLLVLIPLVAGTYYLGPPAINWASQLPRELDIIEQKLRPLTERVQKINETAEQVQNMADVPGKQKPVEVAVQKPGLLGMLMDRASSILLFVGVTVALVYFLLAFGEDFIRKVVHVLPRFADKRRAVEIIDTVRHATSLYFLTITLINIGLGIAIGVVMWLFGMPNPVLWGTMGTLFNFVPYLGAVVGVGIVTMVGIITFDHLSTPFLVGGSYAALTALEGNFVTPTILGRSMPLNPLIVFISLIFWGWLWGIPGAFLAVPMMTSFKILCDRVPQLQALGALLGESPPMRDPPAEGSLAAEQAPGAGPADGQPRPANSSV